MTTLLAWVGADQRGPASIRVAADSRISWRSADGTVLRKWDFGRKVFASQQYPDVVGYCGDVLFPTQTLGQIVELIDRDAFFPIGAPSNDKADLIVAALERAAAEYPPEETRDFSIVYATRTGENMKGRFELRIVPFSAGKARKLTPMEIPNKSGVLTILGSGANNYESYLAKWQDSDVGGTSRAVFSSFCDFLHSESDLKSGGPPQLAGLFRTGVGRSFGIVWNNRLYLMGMEMPEHRHQVKFDCYNDRFELCDPITLERRSDAQRQPNPFRWGLPRSLFPK